MRTTTSHSGLHAMPCGAAVEEFRTRGPTLFSLSRDSVRCSRHGCDTKMIETSQNRRYLRLLCNDTLETVREVRGVVDGVRSERFRTLLLDGGTSAIFAIFLACILSQTCVGINIGIRSSSQVSRKLEATTCAECTVACFPLL